MPILTVTSLDISKKFFFTHVKQHFKDRFLNHKKLFNHCKHKNDTQLSKIFRKIKRLNGIPKISRKITRICFSFNANSKRLILCLNEKYEIATCKGDNLLNKRRQIISTCKNRSNYKLGNCVTID